MDSLTLNENTDDTYLEDIEQELARRTEQLGNDLEACAPKYKMLKEFAAKAALKAKTTTSIKTIENKQNNKNEMRQTLQQNLDKGEKLIATINDDVQKLNAKIDRVRLKMENLKNIFDDLGFYYHMVEPNIFEVRLSRLPIQDYQKEFTFRISIDERNEARVLECSPQGCLNVDEINQKICEQEKLPHKRSFVPLILIIRKQLIQTYKNQEIGK